MLLDAVFMNADALCLLVLSVPAAAIVGVKSGLFDR